MTRSIASAIIGLSGILVAIALLVGHYVSELTFTGLIALTATFSLAVQLLPRLSSINLRNLTIKVSKVEANQLELFARQQDIRNLVILLSELFSIQKHFAGRFMDERSISLIDKWVATQVSRMLANVGISDTERSNLLNTEKVFDSFYAACKEGVNSDDCWNKLLDELELDLRDKERLLQATHKKQ